jgi:hypothetical protein
MGGWVKLAGFALPLCIRLDSPDEASPVCPLFACGGKRAGITLCQPSKCSRVLITLKFNIGIIF